MRHGAAIQSSGAGRALPALRSLQKALGRLHEDLASTCEHNLYTLDYILSNAEQQQQQEEDDERQEDESGEEEEDDDAAGAGD